MQCYGIKLNRSHGAPLRSIRSEGNQEAAVCAATSFPHRMNVARTSGSLERAFHKRRIRKRLGLDERER